MASKTATPKHERISRLGQRRQVVIPREIVESLQMREGDFLAITQRADCVVIKRRQVVDPDDTLTPEEWARVKKAEREMRQGKFISLAQLKPEAPSFSEAPATVKNSSPRFLRFSAPR